MTEKQILTAVKNNGGHIEYTQLLSMNLSESKPRPRADKALIGILIRDGFLLGQAKASVLISITDAGELRLCSLEDQEALEQKRIEEQEFLIQKLHNELESLNQKIQENSSKESAEQKARDRKERSFQVRLSLYSAIFGAVFSNIDRIVAFFIYIWNLF